MMTDASDILVVEDDTLIALDVKATLDGTGLGPIHVAYGASGAMRYIDRRTPRIALLDINLGHDKHLDRDRTSFVAARILRSRGCPIVFLTSYSEKTVPLEGELSGTLRLSKPYDAAELISIVRHILRPERAAQNR